MEKKKTEFNSIPFHQHGIQKCCYTAQYKRWSRNPSFLFKPMTERAPTNNICTFVHVQTYFHSIYSCAARKITLSFCLHTLILSHSLWPFTGTPHLMRTLFNIQLVYFPKSKYAEPFEHTLAHARIQTLRYACTHSHTYTCTNCHAHKYTQHLQHHTKRKKKLEKRQQQQNTHHPFTLHTYHQYADELRHKHLTELSTIIISDIAVSYRSYCRAIVEFRIENLSKVGKDGAHKKFLVRFFRFL